MRPSADSMSPVDSLQKVLAGEHAAVYLYGILGAQSSKSRQPDLFQRLEAAYADHRASRDELTVLISRTGVDPVPAEVSYEVPGRTDGPASIVAAARTIEQRLTSLYGELVAHTSGKDRAWAIDALDRSAVRELHFGARPSDFPGLT